MSFLISVRESVSCRSEHTCVECSRPIKHHERATVLVWFNGDSVWNDYNCCKLPHQCETPCGFPRTDNHSDYADPYHLDDETIDAPF